MRRLYEYLVKRLSGKERSVSVHKDDRKSGFQGDDFPKSAHHDDSTKPHKNSEAPPISKSSSAVADSAGKKSRTLDEELTEFFRKEAELKLKKQETMSEDIKEVRTITTTRQEVIAKLSASILNFAGVETREKNRADVQKNINDFIRTPEYAQLKIRAEQKINVNDRALLKKIDRLHQLFERYKTATLLGKPNIARQIDNNIIAIRDEKEQATLTRLQEIKPLLGPSEDDSKTPSKN